jgi:transformation/transcription domain-associated protein
VLLFPIVWTSLQKEQQTGLAKPIIQLLSKEHHLRQAHLRPTVGQTLLEGISMSQPQPKIPAEMIKYMGRHFHAWHTAISMLESHVGLFPQDMRCFDAVCDLYAALDEDDMTCGLWQRRGVAHETRTAVALQQHGELDAAQDVYLDMMSRGVTGGVQGVTKSEMVLWHNRYLATCAELNQWEAVAEYAKSTDNAALQLDSAAKLHDWAHLKQMVLPKAQVAEDAALTMVRAQLQLSEMSILDVDKLCKAALTQCVLAWWQLPEASPWSCAPALHAFQRAVELAESWRVAMEFTVQGGAGAQYQELKDVCDTWKLRTPNEWEPLRWWSDVLTWRNQVYNMTIRQFSALQAAAPTLHQMGYRDKAWSVNRLGHVARLHNLPETCVHAINTLYGFNAMEVQEAFVKVQEQAKAYMLRPAEHLHGLNLINSTNMDYFQPPHQAEMVSLKAQFLDLLGEHDAAHAAFSEALTLWSLSPDAWVAWGRFCDERYLATKQPAFLEYAGACFAQGIRLSGPEARALVPRLLHLLMLDPHGAEAIGVRTLAAQAADLPTWVWLPWVPQLVTSLQRPETGAARRILVAAAAAHPQFVYWHMRPVISPLKDAAYKAAHAARAAGAAAEAAAAAAAKGGAAAAEGGAVEPSAATGATEPSAAAAAAAEGSGATDAAAGEPSGEAGAAPPPPAPLEKPMEAIAYDNAKEVIEALKSKQSAALQSLEVLMAELGARFASRTDERLLAVIYTLQQRTYRTPLPAGAPVPEAFKKELAGVCAACSSKETAAAAAAAAATNAPWDNWARYQQEFARDLDPASPAAPATLGELTERLKGWRLMLEAVIEDTHPATLKMWEHSPQLVEMALEEVEMPCQPPASPDGPETVFVERIGADVEVVRRTCSSSRRVAFYGSDGQARHFLALQQSGSTAGSEERVNQLLRAANGLLATHPQSRRRGLRFTAPRGVAIFLTGRLVEDDPSATPYVDAWETHCARYGREPDAPVAAFKARTCGEEGMTTDPAARLAAYEEVCLKLVTENVFSQYMYKTMVENSRVMWTFKKQFALSAALSAAACFTLKLTGRAPGKILVSKARGELTHLELAALYNDRLQLEIAGESVPFRLTRNMAAFVGPHGFEGTLVAAAVAAAQGLQQDRSYMPSLLALFLRDDILAYAQRRLNVRAIASLKLPHHQVENAIMFNVAQCLARIERMGPGAPPVPGGPPPANPQAGMRELMVVATSAHNLCLMDPTWQPWL